MSLNDIGLLAKKILVGVAIFVGPLIIIGGILWLTQNVFLK